MDEGGTTTTNAYRRVAQAIAFLLDHRHEQPGLNALAMQTGSSASVIQREFRRLTGISPKRFLQFLTKEYAKKLIENPHTVLDAAYDSGLSGPGRLHDLFVNCEVSEGYGTALVDYGARLMGWPAAERIGFRTRRLPRADRRRPGRERLVESTLVVVPMSDSGRPEGYFVVQPSTAAREPHLRLLCSAGTELFGHLQRIRADREDESVKRLKVGIVAILARSGDPESLEYLREIWRRDPQR